MAELVKKAEGTNLVKASTSTVDPLVLAQREYLKNAKFDAAVRHPLGLSKIAAVLQNPVRKYLDVTPLCRNFLVVEPMPAGQIAYYDSDIHEFSGVKLGHDGSARFLVCKAWRTIVPWFMIVSLAKVPYQEIWWRKYRVLDRVKERLRQAIGMKEDLLGFSLIHDASAMLNSEITVSNLVSRSALARAFLEIERHRLVTHSILTSPEGIFGIRTWAREQVDEVARIEIRQTGYIGNFFGASFYVTNLIRPDPVDGTCYMYILSSPQFTGWMPMWTQAQITPSDRPDDLLIGFTCFEMLGMIIHNARAVARIRFSVSGTTSMPGVTV